MKFNNKESLVFVPGWGMSPDVFKKQESFFRDNYQVYTIDNNKLLSDCEPENISFRVIANKLHNYIKKEDIDNLVFVGWSMGMHIVWYYIRLYGTNNINGIVNVEMVSDFGNDISWMIEENNAIDVNKEDHLTSFINDMFYKKPSNCTFDRFFNYAVKIDSTILKELNKELAFFYGDKIIENINVKTLNLYGANLHFFTQEQIEHTINLTKKSETYWFKKSKHLPFWEEPDLFNNIVSKFISSI